ncbi:MAG: transglutaminase domain-containing protein [Alistipes sp.]|nr:transglutaminase domain-containing protein [Alistipes sp.]
MCNIKRLFPIVLLSAALCAASCGDHLITDSARRAEVHDKFAARRALFTGEGLFDVFDGPMTTAEREAMEFLYGSMSTADMGDYDGEFFLDNVRCALRARDEMAWGRDIPEDLFRHFVLPVRVNNERLDDFRMIYYDTLRRRVEGLSLREAALEINHWCHEKATYTPSDVRTSSPLAVIRTAAGRCGEESTFAVAAMRAVGIPARQVYTPRWAHTDDNHAWVEVWVDGRWWFLGACEPEPDLNVAWFNEPASRAMLMHTRVYGDYHGAEDVIQRTECFTEINVVDTYAPVRRSVVTVTDTAGNPVAGATVEFKIFNYGEYCTVVTLTSDDSGRVALHTGLGDMVVWASHGGRFGVAEVDSEAVTVALDHADGDIFALEMDITPPAPGSIPTSVTEQAAAENKVRLAREDSIRMAYTSTFMTAERCGECDAATRDLLVASCGNWRDVKAFLDGAGDDRARAVAMLQAISRKDLRDTPLDVLRDALEATPAAPLTDEYVQYILSPRIADEFLQPYRRQIRAALEPELGDAPSANAIAAWTRDNIAAADDYNPLRLQATPAGTLRTRLADALSRDIFFVAACRTFGIAARRDVLTGKAQYMGRDGWVDVMMDGPVAARSSRTGFLRMSYTPAAGLDNPDYYRHFTLSRIEQGRCRLLEFSGGDATELGADASAASFSRPFALEEGYYMLTSGNRMASGKVLSRAVTFRITAGETTDVELVMRSADDDIGVVGFIDAECRYLPAGAAEECSLLSTTGRGYFLLAVVGSGDEPTNHALRDLAAIAPELEAWGRPVVVLNRSVEDAVKFNGALLGGVKASMGSDVEGRVAAMLCDGCNSASRTMPLVAVCDSFGRVVYFSQGYNTSLAEQLRNVIHKL